MKTRNQASSSRARLIALALGGCLFLCGHGGAAIIAPGAPAESTPGAFTFAGLTQVYEPGGAAADETFTVTAYDNSNNARYTASVESKVLQDPDGDLDFAYRVINQTSGEPDSIDYISLTGYRGFTTDIDWVAGTGNVTYTNVQRSSIAQGVTVTMNYTAVANNIATGDSTDWVIVKTNASQYDNNGATGLIDGATASVTSFEPTVPEPVSLGVIAVGGIALLAGRPRRRNSTQR